jgi:hypothetical protein
MLLFYFDELCGAVELRARRNAETATCAAHVVGVVGRFCPLSEMQIHTHTRVLRLAFYTCVNAIRMALAVC